MVTCGLCGEEFREDRSQAACRACPLGADCGLVRCPDCGYENPREPGWLVTLQGWFRGPDGEGEGERSAAPTSGPGRAP